SPLRDLSAPAAWLAVATLAFLFKTDEPLKGLAVQRPVAMQMALAAAAVAATLLLVRVRPGHPLAKATRVAAVPGIARPYLLRIVLRSTQRWSPELLVLPGAPPLL